ncbi:MAG: hypothetical protein ACREU3_03195 [Steroidobacteraceae bacterium]
MTRLTLIAVATAALGAATLASRGAVAAPSAPSSAPSIEAGPVTLTFGGFTELASIYRNRNEVADVGSDYNGGIPYLDSPQSQVSEFRFSARQSRFSLLAQGQEFDGIRAEAYMETDFLGAAGTANSRESNSYILRMRVFYGRFTTDDGLDVLLGQNWSLATLYKKGLPPRDENVPLSIDAQYVVGFNWTRNPQIRVVEHFSKAFSLGLSLESPQTVTSNGGITCAGLPFGASCVPSGVDYQNSGNSGGLNNPDTTYTTDIAPDVILKAAFDPGFGHYEIYGLGRWFRSSVSRSDNVASGGGVGAGLILPLVPKVLSFQASGLVGKGIGRYGSGQMPDVTMRPSGALAPLSEYEVMLGLIFTPTNRLTVYGYAGREKESAKYYTVGTTTYGYGAPAYDNSGCYATSGPCVANTNCIDEVTAGMWWKYYEGKLGNLQFGLQAEYFQKNAFAGIGGAPAANMFVGMASLRYYPYQH